MSSRSLVTNHFVWKCAVFAVLTSLANSVGADPLDTITVEAQRDKAKLQREVDEFVAGALVQPRGYGESLWRWKNKVCPLVAGLNRQEGEFVLARLSQIAKAAGAPVDSETCKPNLFVVVTADPELLLKKWWGRDADLFDGEAGSPVNRFIETPRPVRVWYSAGTFGVDGIYSTGLLDASSNRAHQFGGIPKNHMLSASRLTLSTTRNIVSIIVVVDSTRIVDISFGQLADYIGLVGLAQINLDRKPGEAPTILTLFEGPKDSRPKEMTVWDRALLHALYGTTQTDQMQLSQMKTFALKDIVPTSQN